MLTLFTITANCFELYDILLVSSPYANLYDSENPYINNRNDDVFKSFMLKSVCDPICNINGCKFGDSDIYGYYNKDLCTIVSNTVNLRTSGE